ncbi:phosphotransferase family protein [Nocardioides ultimimeridianus]
MTEVLSPAELVSVRSAITDAGTPVDGTLTAKRLSGGRSNVTALLSDAAGPKWVLRMPPRVGRTPSAHDVAREFRVVSALGPTDVPVPLAVALKVEDEVLGCDFAVTGFAAGSAISSQDDLDPIDDGDIDQAIDSLVTSLAALHRVDVPAVGLSGFGRSDAYAERQLRRWGGQWEIVGAETGCGSAATELIRGLSRSIPDQPRSAVIHGDYRIDNALIDFDATPPAVTAIVDWELSTIGDPVADVAMMCAYRLPAFDDVLGFAAAWTSPRIPDAHALAERYAAAGGVELTNWEFHLALAYFKVAVITAGISHRHRVAGGDAGSDTAARAVAPYLEAGLAVLGG